MPTYDFRCPNGHLFEHFFGRISESTSTLACPTCGAIAERQISGGAGLLFKGSGFYITDYGKDGKKDQRTTAKSSSDAPSTASGGESKSSEPKSSESKADSKPTESKPAPAPTPAPSAAKPSGGAE